MLQGTKSRQTDIPVFEVDFIPYVADLNFLCGPERRAFFDFNFTQ